MKTKMKKTCSIQLRVTETMFRALAIEANKRECSIPELIRHATKKFYRISYQKVIE